MPVMELRRAVERFLRRYGEMRHTLGFDGAERARRPESAEPVVIPLPGERARAMRVKPGAIRVERADIGGAAPCSSTCARAGRRVAPALLEAGLDVESVIAPMVAEASSGASVAAVLRVSVSRAHGEYVPRARRTPPAMSTASACSVTSRDGSTRSVTGGLNTRPSMSLARRSSNASAPLRARAARCASRAGCASPEAVP